MIPRKREGWWQASVWDLIRHRWMLKTGKPDDFRGSAGM